MVDPKDTLHAALHVAIVGAFGTEFADADPMVRRSDRADFQVNAALGLSKRLGKPPREVAQAILDNLDLGRACESIEIAGPGFLNIRLSPTFIGESLESLANDERLGVARVTDAERETVVVDYSSPNVAKEMHVGHLRSTVIGDSLCRVLDRVGHVVVRQNHLGDWGTPFGMIIEEVNDGGGTETWSDAPPDLTEIYKRARARFDADPGFAERARKRVVALQAGDGATLEVWNRLVDVSKRYFGALYARLGIGLRLEDVAGESRYNPVLGEIVKAFEDGGLASLDAGAVCVFPPGFTNKEGEPLPLILRKQDGGYGYAATDMAALRYRLHDLRATRVLYVVGAPQSQHLEMVFAAGRMIGWLKAPARAEHVGFGSVLGPDRKMFKTRSGETVSLAGLIDEAERRAEAKIAEASPELVGEERAHVAHAVGVGALKYVDLSSDRVKDYVFDWDRMIAFEGNTGPYLQYAHARIRSIHRKAGAEFARIPKGGFIVEDPAERTLALALFGFGAVVREVAETLQPHKLCTYLYEVASAFSTFFNKCPVLKAETETLRASRLALSLLTAEILKSGLELLGIEAVERM